MSRQCSPLDAQAQAAAGAGGTLGRRAPTVRQGQGRTAGPERLATAGMGLTGLTSDAQDGTPEPRRPHHRRDCEPHRIKAVVVRTWPHRHDGPGGNTVFLTNAAVEKPLPPFDDDDRRLIEPGWSKERQQPWRLQPPPQNTARAVRVHVLCTVLRCAVAPAYRWPCEPEDSGAEPVGWQRWRGQLLEQTRDQVLVCAEGCDGLLPLAEDARLLGVTLKARPHGIGTRQPVLAKYRLTTQRCAYIGISVPLVYVA